MAGMVTNHGAQGVLSHLIHRHRQYHMLSRVYGSTPYSTGVPYRTVRTCRTTYRYSTRIHLNLCRTNNNEPPKHLQHDARAVVMWKERLSGYSTPSTLPPSRPRSQSPAPRAGPHLAPWDASRRPNLSPRSSSLSLILSAGPQQSAGESGTRESSRFSLPGKGPDPLEILERILYSSECVPRSTPKHVVDAETGVGPVILSRDAEVIGSIDFRGQSLRAFAEAIAEESQLLKDENLSGPGGFAECM